ncbi:MAG TPA: ABC-type transport auxiliary lipoprotein family protein [Steroidobacteraceae bacterium]|jgi:cholesterol transport system auxiliary component|nr:ABC-type transport auxiliary lipoprotein family protein [Steroidobacteraceae bacterium]
MRYLRLLPMALLGALCACSGLLRSNAPPLQLYVLQPPVLQNAPQAAVASLRISRPLAAPGLNTDRIALLRPANRLDYYAGSRWSATLPEVISQLQLSVFQNDPAWRAVADDRSNFNAEYLLQTSIERFAADYATDSGPPMIRVDLHCLLIRRSDGILLGSFPVSESQPAQENRLASVVAAFSVAAGRAMASVVGQTDLLLKSAKPPPAP